MMRYFFPLVFLFYFGGITLFSHSHVLNGAIIVHSHPYCGEHSHTDKSLETIFFLSLFYTYGGAVLSFTPILCLILLGVLWICRASSTPKSVEHGVTSLRAPPFCVNV